MTRFRRLIFHYRGSFVKGGCRFVKNRRGVVKKLVLLLAALAAPALAAPAQANNTIFGVSLIDNPNGASLSVPMQIIVLLSALTRAAGDSDVGDALPANRSGAALSPSGLGNADRAFQSGDGRAGVVSGVAGDAAGCRQSLPSELGAAGGTARSALRKLGIGLPAPSKIFC